MEGAVCGLAANSAVLSVFVKNRGRRFLCSAEYLSRSYEGFLDRFLIETDALYNW